MDNAIQIFDLAYDPAVKKIVNRILYNNADFLIKIPEIQVTGILVDTRPTARMLVSDALRDALMVVNNTVKSALFAKVPQISTQKTVNDFVAQSMQDPRLLDVRISDNPALVDELILRADEPASESTARSVTIWASHIEYNPNSIDFVWCVVDISPVDRGAAVARTT